MTRTSRIALLAAVALVVALAGTVVATRSPVGDDATPRLADEHEEADATPEQAALDRAADRLGVDVSRVRDLAAEHGFGTAVRLLAWEAEGATIEDVLKRRAAGDGWGVIAKDLGLHPGLGSVMGNGGGHGRAQAPGQQRDDTDD